MIVRHIASNRIGLIVGQDTWDGVTTPRVMCWTGDGAAEVIAWQTEGAYQRLLDDSGAVAALQTTIAALEARVAALEAAPPTPPA